MAKRTKAETQTYHWSVKQTAQHPKGHLDAMEWNVMLRSNGIQTTTQTELPQHMPWG